VVGAATASSWVGKSCGQEVTIFLYTYSCKIHRRN